MKSLKRRIQYLQYVLVHRRSPSYIRRWQGKRLRELLLHAHQHVPMWRVFLDNAGVKPATVRAITDISGVPITSRQTYIGKMIEEYIDSADVTEYGWSVTSGTSGVPLKFKLSAHAATPEYANASYLRFLWWRGEYWHDFSKLRIARIKVRAFQGPYRFAVHVGDFLRDPRLALKTIAEYDPTIISSYPSILFEAARVIKADPEVVRPSPRYATTFGEMLSPVVRSMIEEAFACELYDRYGLEEIGVVGLECAQHDGFHLNSESLIVEIVDDAGHTMPVGERGRIVVTDLFNYAMPFIRYDTGDQGYMSLERCACGLRLPRIWITGRYSTYLTFPSRKIHHLEFDGAMDSFMNDIYQYQIIKLSDTNLKVRVVAGTTYDEFAEHTIQKNIRELVGESVAVEVEKVVKIDPTPSGKCRIVVDESHT